MVSRGYKVDLLGQKGLQVNGDTPMITLLISDVLSPLGLQAAKP